MKQVIELGIDPRGYDRSPPKKRRRGFAGMDPQRQREISSLGGQRVHELGKGRQFDSEEAKTAGRLGGLKKAERQRSAHSEDT